MDKNTIEPCRCAKEEKTGSTTVWCCNHCGKPEPGSWNLETNRGIITKRIQEQIWRAHEAITRIKGKEYAPTTREIEDQIRLEYTKREGDVQVKAITDRILEGFKHLEQTAAEVTNAAEAFNNTMKRMAKEAQAGRSINRLLKYHERYQINIQLWAPDEVTITIGKDMVELQKTYGNFNTAALKALEYLDKINRKKTEKK